MLSVLRQKRVTSSRGSSRIIASAQHNFFKEMSRAVANH